MQSVINEKAAGAVSISDVVRMHLPGAKDPWKLAIVQRSLVWDEFRIAKLLDSLLAGYPIGQLLLCRTKAATHVLEHKGNKRISILGDTSWQLIDGQQRCNALAAIYLGKEWSDEPQIARNYYLHMSKEKPDLKVEKRDYKIQRYILWGDDFDNPFADEGSKSKTEREYWLNLSMLGDWMLNAKSVDPGQIELLSGNELKKLLRKIDAECRKIETGKVQLARKRLVRLIRLWNEKWFPVQRIELESAEDVLQVFSRVNMEGVRTGAPDIFFAGVKTQWHKAEEVLDEVCSNAIIYSRLSALRFIARMASYELRDADIIPLKLTRLRVSKRENIVKQMEKIATSKANISKLSKAAEHLLGSSGLGYGLRYVDSHLKDHVFGWALMQPGRIDNIVFDKCASYLFWCSALSFNAIFRERFSRNAMMIAINAGRAGKPFPFEEILEMLKEQWPKLSYRRQGVRQIFQDGAIQIKETREVVNRRNFLFLSVAQNIPYTLDEYEYANRIDWDHIFAKALRRKMKWKGKEGKSYKHYHSDSWKVFRSGNLCALDSQINRICQDKAPAKKEEIFTKKIGEHWNEALFLSDKEWRMLIKVDELLEAKEVDKAMRKLKKYVESREYRLWEAAVDRYPHVTIFKDILFG